MKAFYIKGKALVQLSEFKEAIECLNKASQLDPKNNVSLNLYYSILKTE